VHGGKTLLSAIEELKSTLLIATAPCQACAVPSGIPANERMTYSRSKVLYFFEALLCRLELSASPRPDSLSFLESKLLEH
jgi:hypothetical protein